MGFLHGYLVPVCASGILTDLHYCVMYYGTLYVVIARTRD